MPLIENTPELYNPVTPVGRVPAVIDAPVASPPIAYVIFVIGLLMQTVWASVPVAEERTIVEFAFTVIDPFKDRLAQGPVVLTV